MLSGQKQDKHTKPLEVAMYVVKRDPFTHPETGEVHVPGADNECFEMHWDGEFPIGDENHRPDLEPNIWWIPMNEVAIKAITRLLEHKDAARTKYEQRVRDYGGSEEYARTKVAEQMIAEANGHILDFKAIAGKLRASMDEQRKFREKQNQERVAKERTKLGKQHESLGRAADAPIR